MVDISLPKDLVDSKIRDTFSASRGGGGTESGAGQGGGTATVTITIRTSNGDVVPDPIYCEVTGLISNKGVRSARGVYQLRFNPDKCWLPGCPEIKVHDSRAEWQWGLPGNPVVPSEYDFIWGNQDGQPVKVWIKDYLADNSKAPEKLKPGQNLDVAVTLDPVAKNVQLKGLKVVGVPSSPGLPANVTGGDTIQLSATPTAFQPGMPSVTLVKGCPQVVLQADTDPDGYPVHWTVAAFDGATAPWISEFGNWASLATDRAGAFAVGLGVVKGTPTHWWQVIFVEVNVSSSTFTVSPVWGTAHKGGRSGPTSGGFLGDSTAPAFKASAQFSWAGGGADKLAGTSKVTVSIVQNEESENTRGLYEGGATEETTYGQPFPVLDSDSQSDPVMTTGSMVSVVAGSSLTFADSPGPVFPDTVGGKNLVGIAGAIRFRTSIVARSSDARNTIVFLKEASWTIDFTGNMNGSGNTSTFSPTSASGSPASGSFGDVRKDPPKLGGKIAFYNGSYKPPL